MLDQRWCDDHLHNRPKELKRINKAAIVQKVAEQARKNRKIGVCKSIRRQNLKRLNLIASGRCAWCVLFAKNGMPTKLTHADGCYKVNDVYLQQQEVASQT